MSEYVFLPYIDTEDCSSYVYPGELDLVCLGRFRAGHPECPGDVVSGPDIQLASKEKAVKTSHGGAQEDRNTLRRRLPEDKLKPPAEPLRARSPVDKACLVLSFVPLGVLLICLEAGVLYFLWKLFRLVATGFAEVWFLWSLAVDCYPLSGLAQWRACIVAQLENRAAAIAPS